MNLRILSTIILTGLMTACASTQPTLSESYRNSLLTMAPKIEKCEAIDQIYSDLSVAPADVVAGISPQVREVWTLKGCPDGKRKRAELRIMNNNNGTLSFSEY